MNRTKIVPKTGIEMGHRAWNVFEGHCPYACWYCWSLDNKRRFKEPEPLRWNEERFNYRFPKEPSRILVCWTIDLMHPQIRDDQIQRIIDGTTAAPHCNFLFLTKHPVRYGRFDFPKNCWLGVTVTNQGDCERVEGVNGIVNLKEGRNKLFVSCEPLLGELETRAYHWDMLDWIIIGAMTGTKAKQYQPKKEWVEHILYRCTGGGIRASQFRVFLKDNLKKVWGKKLIQEFPK